MDLLPKLGYFAEKAKKLLYTNTLAYIPCKQARFLSMATKIEKHGMKHSVDILNLAEIVDEMIEARTNN
jgi:hypothetical protein